MRKTPSSPAVAERMPPFELEMETRTRDCGMRPVGLMMCPCMERLSLAVPPLLSPRCAPTACALAPSWAAQSSPAAKSRRAKVKRGCEVLTDTFLKLLLGVAECGMRNAD